MCVSTHNHSLLKEGILSKIELFLVKYSAKSHEDRLCFGKPVGRLLRRSTATEKTSRVLQRYCWEEVTNQE
jgi:hypothetical protein